MLYLLSPFSTPLAVVWMNVVCWLKILVQKCRRRRCCYSDMLLLITLIALACLCDSHRRLQCTRCVCVLCMQECVSVSCIRALDVTVCLCVCVYVEQQQKQQQSHFNFNFAILAAARWHCLSNCLPSLSLSARLSVSLSLSHCLSVCRTGSFPYHGRQAGSFSHFPFRGSDQCKSLFIAFAPHQFTG